MTAEEQKPLVRAGAWPRLFLCAVVTAAVVGFFAVRIGFFAAYPDLYRHPEVLNLTAAEVEWETHYGSSPRCGPLDCFVTSGYPSSAFERRFVLPMREFPLRDYKAGDAIYYRTVVALPQEMLAGAEPIVLHALYMWAERYSFYVEETRVAEGGNEQVQVSIPRALIPADGRVHLAFHLEPGSLPFQGLANKRDLLIGPRSAIAPLTYLSRDLSTNYYLLFLLPRLTLCLLGTLFLLVAVRRREVFAFVIFCFLGALHQYLQTAYAVVDLPAIPAPRQMAVGVAMLVQLSLLFLLMEMFRVRSRRLRWGLGAVASLSGVGLALAYNVVSPAEFHGIADGATRTLQVLVLVVGLGIIIHAMRAMARVPRARARLAFAAATFALLAVAGTLGILEMTGVLQGRTTFLITYTADLILLVFIAGAVVYDLLQTRRQRDEYRSIAAAQAEQLAKDRVAVAIAQTTRMFAHDVRKPFTLVKLLLGELAARGKDDLEGVLARFAPAFERSSQGVEAMISSLLRPDGRPAGAGEGVDLREVVVGALSATFSVRSKSSIRLSYEMKARGHAVADAALLQRAVTNLLDNAADATGARGHIWIGTRDLCLDGGAKVELTVGNSGSPVPAEIADRIFDPFFTHGKPGGTGLGLSIVKTIVTEMGGSVTCHSSGQECTVFRLVLPAQAAASQSTVALPYNSDEVVAALAPRDDAVRAAFAMDASASLRILLLDDDPFILEAWTQSLQPAVVTAYSDPTELWSAVRSGVVDLGEFDVIVTDQHFQSSDYLGLTFIDQARQQSEAMFVLSTDDRATIERLPAGCVHVGKHEVGREVIVRHLRAFGRLRSKYATS